MRKNSLEGNVPAARLRYAIYTRKSTEEGLEQDFNSLDAHGVSARVYSKSYECFPSAMVIAIAPAKPDRRLC